MPPPTSNYIWGSVPSAVDSGVAYSFTPSAADVDPTSDTLTFSVINKPAWATFSSATGLLAGTPTEADIPVNGSGLFSNVDICVTDGIIASPVCLGAFTITVNDATAPAAVNPFTGTVTDGQVTLTWSDPADADLEGVTVRSSIISTPASETAGSPVGDIAKGVQGVADSGLDNGVLYYYAAFAHDEAPNFASGAAFSAMPIPLDPTFGAAGTGFVTHDDAAGGNANDEGWAVALDGQGRILVAGWSYNASGNQDMTLWRYDSGGVLDTTFGTGGIVVHHNAAGGNGNDLGYAVALDGQGRILVAGHSINASGNLDMALWRYDSGGALDTTFGTGGIVTHASAAGGVGPDYGYAVALDGSGRILVAGNSVNASGNYDMALWRYNDDGYLDTTFGTGGIVTHDGAAGSANSFDVGNAVALDGSGRILVAGYSTDAFGYGDMVLWRYDESGALDSTFGTGGIASHDNAAGGAGFDLGNAVALDGQGRILVTGYSENDSGNQDMTLWRYDSSGVLDSSFGTGGIVTDDSAAGGFGNDIGHAVFLDGQGRILVAGDSTNSSGNLDMALWRYDDSGVLDTAYSSSGFAVHHGAAGGNSHDLGYAAALDGQGRILVTGYSRNASGNDDMALWRFTPDGVPAAPTGVADTTFGGDVYPSDGTPDGFVVDDGAAGGTNGHDYGLAMTLDGSGSILVAGYSRNASGNDDMALWRYDSSGLLDTAFNSGGTTPGIVVHDNAAGGNGDDYGYAVALDGSGRILVAGSSRNASGNSDMALWRYTAGGVLDTSFNSGGAIPGIVFHDSAAGWTNSNDYGNAMALDGSGNILVAGFSTNASGNYDMALWRYTAGGVLDTSFNSGGAIPGIVVHDSAAGGTGMDYGRAVTVDGSGSILVAGESVNASGNIDMALWRFMESGVLDTSFGTNGIVVHDGAAGGAGNDYGLAVAVDGSGRILVAGPSTNASGNHDMALWRYMGSGVLDTSFGTNGIVVQDGAAGGASRDNSLAVALDGWGRILVAGFSTNASGNHDMALWRYNDSGLLDTAFNSGGTTPGIVVHDNAAGGTNGDYGLAVALDSWGRILVAGRSINASGNNDMVLWRYE